MYRFIAATLVVLFCPAAIVSAASMDDVRVTYQGNLLDEEGNPAAPGVYGFQFGIYRAPSGGTALWETVEPVEVGAGGLFSVILGPISVDVFLDPSDPDDDGIRFLQIVLLPEQVFEPRTPVTATPYAAVAGRLDGDVTTDKGVVSMIDTTGDTIRVAQMKTSGGASSLSLQSLNPLGETRGTVTAKAGYYDARFSLYQPLAETPSIELRAGDFDPRLAFYDVESGDTSVVLSKYELRFRSDCGTDRAINATTTYKCDGLYSIDTTGDTILAVVSNGDITTKGAVTSGNSITIDGTADQIRVSDGALAIGLDPSQGSFTDIRLGIGLADPTERLDVAGVTKTQGFVMPPGAVGGHVLTCNADGVGTWQPATGGGGWVDAGPVTLQTITDSVGIGTSAPVARLHVESDDLFSGYFRAAFPATGTAAVFAQYDGPAGPYDARGIYAYSRPQDNYGIGGYFEGGYNGAYGKTTATGAGGYMGVRGRSSGGSGTNYGVHGTALNSSGENIGIYGTASSDADGLCYGVYGLVDPVDSGYAGYFDGNVWITGNLHKGGGSFTIDHPLDPENKFLQHSFVESPDMMNVYNGNVTTDDSGDAVVTLPDYFMALNGDFRYQLTVIGQFAQAIVAEKISDGRFSIKTDKPNVEVSWQVTGIRQDPYANANRIPVEISKRADQRGMYMHPAAYGFDETRSIDFAHRQTGEKRAGQSSTE